MPNETRHAQGGDAGAPDPGFPEGFAARMRALLPEEHPAFFSALAAPAAGLRVNTLRLEPEEFARISPFRLEPLGFPPEGFLLGEGERPGRHPYHAAGLYYLQDPGAMAVGALLDPRPGERVLDLAAAPGGKTTHLAARMRDRGVLLANDVQPVRARELAGNLERCGVRGALVTSEAADRLADRFGPWFDRVLLDAPCSGESMFHKSRAARLEWSPAAVAGCARRQDGLLAEAARLVRPGGLLAYSTCTFAPEENECVAARFLADHPDFEAEALPAVPGALAADPEWAPDGLRRPEIARALRLWPHRVPGAGHFVAAFRRGGGEEAPGTGRAAAPAVPRAALVALEEFLRDAVAGGVVALDRLALRGEELFQVPEAAPALERLRTVRPGWWLGSVRKGRFEPSHTLALGLRAGEALRTLDLPAGGHEVDRYLRGETLTAPGEKGWLLVTVDGFPLGWGKRVGATVKNHYPKGLRRR
jgi:16S rRNA C967 or C1407 C5-methylase (RsmB/RsmF family)/NOL1/NOP2/fmu family ribosome biogenesis protein